MNREEATQLLASGYPSQRVRAMQWFLSNASSVDSLLTQRALEKETVPALRHLLHRILQAARRVPAEVEPQSTDLTSAPPVETDFLDNLSSLLRHETEPIIGWLRRTAAKEIGPDYSTSETFRNIDILRQRLLGLESLTAAHRRPRWSRESLRAVINACRPPEMPRTLSDYSETDDHIDTDRGLLTLIVSNALVNAQEASTAVGPDEQVWIDSSVTSRTFYITVTNRFEGQSFDLEHVMNTGASSKSDHKGLGLYAMRLASERLGYNLSLRAASGTAFLTLTGSRFRD